MQLASPSHGTQAPRPRAVYVDVAAWDVSAGRALLEAAGFNVTEATARSEQDVIAAARGAAALLVADTPVTRRVLDALPELEIVATATVGVDHIDVAGARERGIWVCNVPDAATEEVAVHALALGLALVRELPAWDRNVRNRRWSVEESLPLQRPSTMTLGVIGVGKIGRKLAELGRPIFATVVGTDPYIPDREWPTWVKRMDVADVFAAANVLSLHVPLTEETDRLVDERRLASMKRGSYLINVARGRLVDRPALLDALDRGVLAGAGLDVFPEEPPDPDDPLLDHPRILLSPHVAFLSDAAEREYVVRQAENVLRWWQDSDPVTPVGV